MSIVIEPRGNDLATTGITRAELPEGQPVGCRVGDQPVVAVRTGDEVFVLDAACTHYGADLAWGRVVDGALRCAWHHACFALRNGATTHAPALRDLPCWKVERTADRWFARAPAPAPVIAPRAGPGSILVIGAGAAGSAAVETLRAEGYQGSITWVGRESPVDRPNLSKDYLAGTAPEEWMPLRDDAFYAEQRVTTRFGREVVALDAPRRTATLDDGEVIRWDALILAPGSQPIRLPIPGADGPRVHLLRTLADSRAIRASAAAGHRAVVLGSSFIGLECAMSLRTLGLEVDVVGLERVPLERVLGPEVGAFLQHLYEEKGVRFHLGVSAASISPDAVVLSNGSSIPRDLVVMGVGVRPELTLAKAAGLPIDNGVLVDAQLRAAPAIWVAGDAARYPDRDGTKVRIEHWVAAMAQGRCAARSALGGTEPFREAPFFWSAHGDAILNWVGRGGAWDRIDKVGSLESGSAVFAYRAGDRTLGVLTFNRDDASLEAHEALQAGDEAWLARLIPRGAAPPAPAA